MTSNIETRSSLMQIAVCIRRDLKLPHILVETVFILFLPMVDMAWIRSTVIYEKINLNLSFSASLQASMPLAYRISI